MPTLPKAQMAAARLGCPETFAVIDDRRSPSIRIMWIAEQVSTHKYELREKLGEGYIGRELDDPFAMIYMQCMRANVQVLSIEQGTPPGPKEIRDDRGAVIVRRLLSLADGYDRSTSAVSEASLAAKAIGDVVWLAVIDDQGKEIASAPVKITSIDKDANGRPAAFHFVGDKGSPTSISLDDPANLTGSQVADGEYVLWQATAKPDDDEDTTDDPDSDDDEP